jgi:hypothetical protein
VTESNASATLPALDAKAAPGTADGASPGEPLPDPNDPVRSLPPKAHCIWCGAAVRYLSETEARDHWGYCSAACREDFVAELGCDPEVAFNRSRRARQRKAPPAFLRDLAAGAKAHAAGFDAAPADPDAVDPLDDLEEPEAA